VATGILMMVATNAQVAFSVALADGDECLALRGDELPARLPAVVAFQEALP
jgi:hypothetical protein